MNDTKYFRDEGIVVRVVDVKDNDQILTIYSKNHGKISVYAKGIRNQSSKLREAATLGKILEIEAVQGNELLTLTGVNDLFSYSNFTTDLEYLIIINQMTEIIDKLAIKDDLTDELMYQLLKKSLMWLEDNNPWIVGKYYEWHMMTLLGYTGELDCCSECNTYFHRGQWRSVASIYGGFYCKQCIKFQDKNSLLFFGEEENGFLRFLENADEKNIGVYYPTAKLIRKMNIYFKKSWENIFDYPLNSYNYLTHMQ